MDLDDETLVIIEESNVDKTINDVTIYEEKIKDNSVLILNNEQITHELTNLLVNTYKNVFKTKKKVNMYINLFDSVDIEANIYFDNLKPIIYCKKYVMLNGSKDDKYLEVDQEFQDTYELQTQSFQTYIGQFKNLNSDKTNTYLHSTNALYSLAKPFTNSSATKYTYDRLISNTDNDIFRHFILNEFDNDELIKANVNKNETFRVLKPISIDTGKKPEVPDEKPGCTSGLHYILASNEQVIYEGDKIDVVGYINVCNDNLDLINYFNLNIYFEYLKKLPIKSKVNIFFNDFVFDIKGKLISQIEGIVSERGNDYLVIKPPKQMIINGVYLKDLIVNFNKGNYCFIYDNKYEGYKFHKQLLKKDTIVFTLLDNSPTTLSIIKPNSISELLYVNKSLFQDITNIFDLKKLINNTLHIDFDKITLDIKHILSILINIDPILPPALQKIHLNDYHISQYNNNVALLDFNKFGKFLKLYSQSYNDIRTFRDSTLNRYAYLLDKNDYGYVYILQIIKEKVLSKHNSLKAYEDVFNKKINISKEQHDKVNKQISQQSQNKEIPKIIAKEYMTFEDLELDNKKTKIFFDKSLDHTKYEILSKINKTLSGNEQIYAIINLLEKNEEMVNKTRGELEYEAKSIVNGTREVLDGHYSILHLPDGSSTLYLRKNITNSQTWIKILKTPFKICTNNLQSFDELENNDSLVLDPFELLCKKQKNVKLSIINHILTQQILALESIIVYINDIDNIIESIDLDIEFYKKQFQLFESESLFSIENVRRLVNVKLPEFHEESNIYEDYIGNEDLLDLDAIFGNIEYGENYAPIIGSYTKKEKDKLEDNEDILKTFIRLLDINLSEPVYNYIIQQILAAYPLKNLLETFKEKEIELNNTILKYTKNDKLYKAKKNEIDALIKKQQDKYKEFEINEYKKYYSRVILYTAAILILVIMIEYPTIIVNKLIPKCVKFFSYIGYPLSSNNATQSLTKYFACIIGSIGTPGDLQFDQFTKMSVTDIEAEIVNMIDSIKEVNFNISETLEQKKELLLKIKNKFATDYSLYNTLNDSFKPNFDFKGAKISNLIINYMNEINNSIKHSKILKYSNNIASLINSCCIEQLSNTMNFYNFFKGEPNFKIVHDKIKSLSNDFVITRSLIPKIKTIKTVDLFMNKEIIVPITNHLSFKEKIMFTSSWKNIKYFIEANNSIIKNDIIIKELLENFEDVDGWWSNVFYTFLDSNLESITNYIKKYHDATDSKIINQLKLIVSGKSFTKSENLRESIFTYMKFRFPTIISRLVNHKIITDEESPFAKLQESIINNSKFESILKKYKTLLIKSIDDVFFSSNNDETIITLNISLLSYILIKLLISILYVTLYDDQNIDHLKLNSISLQLSTIQKQNQRISCHIVYFIIEDFITYIDVNDTDNDKIKKRVEELREKRKQELIAAYSSDAEKRKLQILLKKMGLKIEGDPDDLNKEEKEKPNLKVVQNITDFENAQLENENYTITFNGDNADADEIDEDYFVNQEHEFES